MISKFPIDQLYSYVVFFPAAILCYLPMKNQLVKSWKTLALQAGAAFLCLAIPAAWLTSLFPSRSNLIFMTATAGCFIFYVHSVKAHFSKAAAIFIHVCAVLAIISDGAAVYDAFKHPDLGIGEATDSYTAFQLAGTLAAVLISARPFSRYLSMLVDKLDLPRVWYMTIPFALCILFLCIMFQPVKYETLHYNRVGSVAIISLSVMMVMWIVMAVIFYMIVTDILDAAETEEKRKILEIQASQYDALTRYIAESSRSRHDLRQIMRTIRNMADAGDLEALKKYMDSYMEHIPVNKIELYCSNSAVNALLNYYAGVAEKSGIEINWNISLEDTGRIDDVDLCGMLGNVLENAVRACGNVPEGEAFIQLTITNRNNRWLYIVETNSFDGKVIMSGGKYLSVRRKGTGLGLDSIRSTAEYYGGHAEFSHKGREFYTNIVVPVTSQP